jgi:hypothetical protein
LAGAGVNQAAGRQLAIADVDDETDKATVEGLEEGLLAEMNIIYHSC